MRLLELLSQELGSRSMVANELEISKSTLSGWMNEEKRYPCNVFLDRILSLSWELNSSETRIILDDELRSFAEEISSFVRGGPNSQIDGS